MSKQIEKKELVFIDYERNIAKFFTIELLSVGYNQMQVISNTGHFNNKGREHIVRFDGESAFKEAKKLVYKRFLEKKSEGFVEKADIQKWHLSFHEKYFDEDLTRISLWKQTKRKKAPVVNKQAPLLSPVETNGKCGSCKKLISPKMYDKINGWGRGEGNWDSDASFIGYQKVLCIDCQIEHDVFKKKR